MDLCEMCNRLLIIVEAQQEELEKLGANKRALDNWKRESAHIREMLYKTSDLRQ